MTMTANCKNGMSRSNKTLLSWPTILLFALCLQVSFASDDDKYVTCGSFIKLSHGATGYSLNSESKNLNSGSGQQLVTFVKNPSTQNTLWWVRPEDHSSDQEYPKDGSCQLAEPLPCGTIIRLTHMDTLRNLHSHGVKSVLSHQQEVSAYGEGDGNGDGGDNWRVECSSKFWMQESPFRLHHMDTGKYLGTSKQTEFNKQTCGQQCPIMGHLEAFGRETKDQYTELKVTQGVHLYK